MSVDVDEVKSLLASKLTLLLDSDVGLAMAPEMLLYNIALVRGRYTQAEEDRKADEMQHCMAEEQCQQAKEALVHTKQLLSWCICGQSCDHNVLQVGLPVPHLSRQVSSPALKLIVHQGAK